MIFQIQTQTLVTLSETSSPASISRISGLSPAQTDIYELRYGSSQADTPELIDTSEKVFSSCQNIRSQLKYLRDEQHRIWWKQKEFSEQHHDHKDEQKTYLNPNNIVIEALNHKDNLIANIDITGIFDLVKQQFNKIEDLHYI